MTGNEYRRLYAESPEKAYAALFKVYCDYVYAIVYNKLNRVAQREDIDECVSDIFADIFFSYKRNGEDYADLKAYIGTIAKRHAINSYRSLKLRSERFSGDSDEEFASFADDTDIETNSDDRETRSILISKINELGEPDSTIILQKYYYDRSSGEIAEMMSMKASAVRMRAARALEKLKKSLAAAGIML
ncbi:MAG: sigma-70 family RNA polymerase sigma factor [Ruminococcus sp.]|nr:sigma-70 family RNA polymerase sigma factor [Ruminococcus sp.]